MPPLRERLMDYAVLCFVTTALMAMVTGGIAGLLAGLAELFQRPWSEVPSGGLLLVALVVFGALLGRVAAAIGCPPVTVALWTLAAALTAAAILPNALPFILFGGLAALPIAHRTRRRMMHFTQSQATP